MSRMITLLAAALMAVSLPAFAETRIGVVDLRQALFSSCLLYTSPSPRD